MKIVPVTKPEKRNRKNKKNKDDFMSTNCEDIVAFSNYG